jgi:uncharacterized FlgJ-related protein
MKKILNQKQIYLDLLEDEIIKEVKNILKNHKNLIEFTDLMGSNYFTDKNNNTVNLISSKSNKNTGWNTVYYPTYKYFNKLLDLYSIEQDYCIYKTIKI